MTNNSNPLTVRELRRLLENQPDDRVVFVFDPEMGTHQPVTGLNDDKRSGSVNIWVN